MGEVFKIGNLKLSVSKSKKYFLSMINDDLYDLLIEMDIKKKRQ
jgi:hypothetical protein